MTWQIHRYASVESTMTLAAPMPVGSVVVADEQTAGIGRHGHNWESEHAAGLYVSIVLPSHPVLTLALGLAAHAAIQQVTSLVADIRWPNDLMLGPRKFGGILVQMHDVQVPDGPKPAERAVAGIGINIGQRRFPSEIASIATSLAMETGLDFRRDDILDALLAEIPRACALSVPSILADWEATSTWGRGKAVSVDLGERTITGITCGLDAAGFLRVRTSQGVVETILAGGVRPA